MAAATAVGLDMWAHVLHKTVGEDISSLRYSVGQSLIMRQAFGRK